MPSYSGVWTLPSQYQARGLNLWPVIIPPGAYGYLFSNSATDTIQYFNIPSGGTTTSFGGRFYSNTTMYFNGALSNSIYGVQAAMASPNASKLAYITLSNGGSNGAWGDLTQNFGLSSTCANSTRGLIGADANGPAYNTINYITWATTGNASFFGELIGTYQQQGSGTASPTRGLFQLGYDQTAGAPTYAICNINYVTIATTGNATFFGNLITPKRYDGSTSSSTRGLFLGGYNNDVFYISTIEYVTIASTGNATSFGNLVAVASQNSSTSDSIKGVICGGNTTGGTTINTISYVTIASTGNATNYGTLAVSTNMAACSNSHGGL